MADFDRLAREVTPDQLAQAIGARPKGKEWMCPRVGHHNHEDTKPSVAIGREGDRTVLTCHGCGLAGSPVQVAAEVWGVDLPEAGNRLAELYGIDAGTPPKSEIVEAYPYTDEAGELLYEVVRYKPKRFRQRRPDGSGGWTWRLEDARRVPYRLPEVLAAVAAGITVHVVEGERDVHAIEAAGGVATTAPGGAGKWRTEYSETLRGARVVVVADRDEAGVRHAWEVAGALEGVAASVEVVEPVTGKDAEDHLAAGHELDTFEAATPATVTVPVALFTDARLPDATRSVDIAVYAVIEAHGPKLRIEDISRAVGRGDSAVGRSRRRLRTAGWIRWRRRKQSPSVYTLSHPVATPRPVAGGGASNQEDRSSKDGQEPKTGRERGLSSYSREGSDSRNESRPSAARSPTNGQGSQPHETELVADPCPKCGGQLVDSVCEPCGLEVVA